MSQLNLEDSALLAKMKRELEETKNRLQELEEKLEEDDSVSERLKDLIDQNAQIENVEVSEKSIKFELSDDREIAIPIWWSWQLEEAEPKTRQNYVLSDDKSRVVWPELNEEISVTGILTGDPAPRPEESE
jgi:hypothetical protein